MQVKIMFRTPSRAEGQEEPTVHDRTLEEVPRTEAEQMAEDFVQYRSAADGAEKSVLYRYEKEGQEVLVALDFEEVIALTASADS